MFDPNKIKGIIFDYGGTIDSNGMHWAEVIWEGYINAEVPVTKEVFREAYVHAERTLAKVRLVLPHHNFHDMLSMKTRLQLDWLLEHQHLDPSFPEIAVAQQIADYCYAYAKKSVEAAKPIIKQLAAKYPLILVSNFYGNIESVLKDFGLADYFQSIVESAVVGVRKPDPLIFQLGLDALALPGNEVVVIGDSHDKDIIPAHSLGSQTIWLKSIGWSEYKGDQTADVIIGDFQEMKEVFCL